jgi:hypothetical protein
MVVNPAITLNNTIIKHFSHTCIAILLSIRLHEIVDDLINISTVCNLIKYCSNKRDSWFKFQNASIYILLNV